MEIKSSATTHTGICLSFLLAVIGLMVMFDILDLDLFWHLANGRAMVAQGEIVNSEIFSYTAYGNYFSNHQWLAEIVLFLLFSAWGVAGLYAFKICLSTLTALLLFLSARSHGAKPLTAAFWSLVVMIVCLRRLLVRPEMFSLVGIALLMYLCYGFRRGKVRPQWLFAVPVIMVLWDFLHGAIYGCVFLGVFVAGESCKAPLHRRWPSLPGFVPLSRDHLRFLWKIGCLTLAVMLVSPYGLRSYDIFYQLVSGQNMAAHISEFRSPPLIPEFYPFWFLLGGCLVVMAVTAKKNDLTYSLVLLVFAVMALRYMRAIAPFAIVALPVMITATQDFANQHKSLFKRPVRATLLVLSLLLSLGYVGQLKFFSPGNFLSFGGRISDTYFPTGPVRFIKAMGLNGQMFNTDSHGGYLSYYLAPERKIFHYNHHVTFRNFNDYFKNPALLIPYNFNYALIRERRELQLFPLNSWALVYRSQCGLVLVKRNEANAKLISQYEIRYFSPFLTEEEFNRLAQNPLVRPELIREMIVYLAFQRDERVAVQLDRLIEQFGLQPLSPNMKNLLKQVDKYNPGSLSFDLAIDQT